MVKNITLCYFFATTTNVTASTFAIKFEHNVESIETISAK